MSVGMVINLEKVIVLLHNSFFGVTAWLKIRGYHKVNQAFHFQYGQNDTTMF